jgi:hypothetical protein
MVASVLALASDRWAELEHAYGRADNIPLFLGRLAAGDATVLDDLFGSLCQQSRVYTASFATVPHLVAIANTTADAELRAHILIVVGSIRANGTEPRDVDLEADLESAYEAALPRALRLALVTLQQRIHPETAVRLLEAAAALNGYVTAGRVLSHFVDAAFCPPCPGCGRELFVWPDEVGLTVAAEDPVHVPDTRRLPVAPGPVSGTRHASQHAWLLRVAGPAALSLIGGRLSYLFGTADCPACGRRFSLIDELE